MKAKYPNPSDLSDTGNTVIELFRHWYLFDYTDVGDRLDILCKYTFPTNPSYFEAFVFTHSVDNVLSWQITVTDTGNWQYLLPQYASCDTLAVCKINIV